MPWKPEKEKPHSSLKNLKDFKFVNSHNLGVKTSYFKKVENRKHNYKMINKMIKQFGGTAKAVFSI